MMSKIQNGFTEGIQNSEEKLQCVLCGEVFSYNESLKMNRLDQHLHTKHSLHGSFEIVFLLLNPLALDCNSSTISYVVGFSVYCEACEEKFHTNPRQHGVGYCYTNIMREVYF